MAKVNLSKEFKDSISIDEENLKSKHPDSFRILKKHGYEFINSLSAGGELYELGKTKHIVHIKPNGRWTSYDHKTNLLGSGPSHSDLEAHLVKVNK